MRTIEEIVSSTHTSLTDGLTSQAAESSRRTYGANVFTPPQRTPLWKRFLEKFNEPIIRILLLAAGVSIGIALWKGEGHFLDGIAILLAVGLATGVAFLSELKSDREFALLN